MYGLLVLLLLGITITLIALLSTRFGVFEEVLEIVRITIWPAIVMSALLFFRKALTYLLLSIEELNVFGAKSRLKNVQEVIEEKARELIEKEKREVQAKHKIIELEESLRRLKERTKNKDRVAEIANELVQENTELWELLHKKDAEIEKLKSENTTLPLKERVQVLESHINEMKKEPFAKP